MMLFFFPFAFLLFFLVAFTLSRVGLRFFQRLQRRGEPEDNEEEEPRFPRWPSLPRGFPAARLDPEARVFRLAYKRRGRITVSDAVIDLGLSIRQAEELLNGLVDGLRVRMEVTPNGLVVYEFPEILSRFQKS